MIGLARPLLGVEEEAAILRVLASGRLAQGEVVAAFEQRPNSTRPERQDIFGRSDLQTTPRMSRAELLPGGNTGFR